MFLIDKDGWLPPNAERVTQPLMSDLEDHVSGRDGWLVIPDWGAAYAPDGMMAYAVVMFRCGYKWHVAIYTDGKRTGGTVDDWGSPLSAPLPYLLDAIETDARSGLRCHRRNVEIRAARS